jgi:hypothetical protein
MQMLKTYLKRTLGFAASASWKAVNGLAGAALAGFALIWPGVFDFAGTRGIVPNAANWLLSFLIYALVAWSILFAFQLIFIAPYRLWRLAEAKAAKTDAKDTDDQLQHDRVLAAKVRELFPESTKRKLESDLVNDHAYWDTQSLAFADLIDFLDSAEAHFLDMEIRDRAKKLADASAKLLEFMGFKFFIYPHEQRDRPMRSAMQPRLNLDREGDGSDEQIRKYDELTDQLSELTKEMSGAYNDLIRAFHERLRT